MPDEEGGIGRGIAIGVLLTLAGLIAIWALVVMSRSAAGIIFLFGIGVTQLVWVVPAVLYFQKDGQKETVKGILIVAALTFLLNASCWGVIRWPR